MKSENHQDIIKEIADRLREHSLPYKEGAWERFKEVEKKKPRYLVLLPYLSAAAAILIAIILFLKPEENKVIINELVEQRIDRNEIEKNSKRIEKERVENLQARVVRPKEVARLASKIEVRNQLVKDDKLSRQAIIQVLEDEKVVKPTSIESAHVAEVKVTNSNPLATNTTPIESPLASSKAKEKKNSVEFIERLLNIEEKEGLITNKITDKKWSVGIDVSPNVSSSRQVNMGGGVAFAYSVSPKISFSSGVSYLQLDAQQMPHAPSRGGSMSMDSPSYPSIGLSPQKGVNLASGTRVKTLNKSEANLIGLDIPLTINYHVSKNFYASAGVSVFNVLNEERINQYENQEVEVLYKGADNKTPEPMYRTFYSTEVVSEKLYEGKNLSGFFNFSVGYSIPVSKKVGLSIEPFLKITMGSMGEEDMNLRNGGIKIGTRF
jgi:hypothetical protein